MEANTYVVSLRDGNQMVRRVVVGAASELHAKERGRSALIRAGVAANPRATDARPLREDEAVVLDAGIVQRRPGIIDMKGS